MDQMGAWSGRGGRSRLQTPHVGHHLRSEIGPSQPDHLSFRSRNSTAPPLGVCVHVRMLGWLPSIVGVAPWGGFSTHRRCDFWRLEGCVGSSTTSAGVVAELQRLHRAKGLHFAVGSPYSQPTITRHAAAPCRHTRRAEGGLVRWPVRTRGQGKAQCKARAAGAARWRGRGA